MDRVYVLIKEVDHGYDSTTTVEGVYWTYQDALYASTRGVCLGVSFFIEEMPVL